MKKLQQTFRQVFNSEAKVTASAPGRLEILGNHTDYNEGVVLSCAVDQRKLGQKLDLSMRARLMNASGEFFALGEIVADEKDVLCVKSIKTFVL